MRDLQTYRARTTTKRGLNRARRTKQAAGAVMNRKDPQFLLDVGQVLHPGVRKYSINVRSVQKRKCFVPENICAALAQSLARAPS